jgi:hypothetical protein
MAYGDVYLEWEQITKSVPGVSDAARISRNYCTSHAFRADTGDQIMIMDFDSMTVCQLRVKDRTYTKADMNKIHVMPERAGETIHTFQVLLNEIIANLYITPTSEMKKIAGYTCRKHNVTHILISAGECWLCRDVDGYKEVNMIAGKMATMFKNNPTLKYINFSDIINKLDGFPVRTVIETMGCTTTISLRCIKKKPLSKDLFRVPDGYMLKTNNRAGLWGDGHGCNKVAYPDMRPLMRLEYGPKSCAILHNKIPASEAYCAPQRGMLQGEDVYLQI